MSDTEHEARRLGFSPSFYEKHSEHILEHIMSRKNWQVKVRDAIASYLDRIVHAQLGQRSKETENLKIRCTNMSSEIHRLRKKVAKLEGQLNAN